MCHLKPRARFILAEPFLRFFNHTVLICHYEEEVRLKRRIINCALFFCYNGVDLPL